MSVNVDVELSVSDQEATQTGPDTLVLQNEEIANNDVVNNSDDKRQAAEVSEDQHLESLDTVLAAQQYQTGARPKDTSPTPLVHTALPEYSETDLVTALEPTIPSHVPEQDHYVEEAEYLDLDNIES